MHFGQCLMNNCKIEIHWDYILLYYSILFYSQWYFKYTLCFSGKTIKGLKVLLQRRSSVYRYSFTHLHICWIIFSMLVPLFSTWSLYSSILYFSVLSHKVGNENIIHFKIKRKITPISKVYKGLYIEQLFSKSYGLSMQLQNIHAPSLRSDK